MLIEGKNKSYQHCHLENLIFWNWNVDPHPFAKPTFQFDEKILDDSTFKAIPLAPNVKLLIDKNTFNITTSPHFFGPLTEKVEITEMSLFFNLEI